MAGTAKGAGSSGERVGSILFTFMLEQQRRDWIARVIKIKNDGAVGVKLKMTKCF